MADHFPEGMLPPGCGEADLHLREVRGPILFQIRQRMQQEQGEDGWQRLLAQVSEPCRETFRNPLGFWEWVPIAHSYELTQVYVKEAGGHYHESRGRDSARDHLSGLSAWFMRMASPSFLVLNLPHIWRFYMRGGLVTVDDHSGSSACLSLWAIGGYPEMFSATLRVWCEEALKMAGAKAPKVEYLAPEARDGNSMEARMAAHRHRYRVQW